MKRLIIVGSPRANGRSAHLAEMLFEANIDEHPEDELFLVPVSEVEIGPCIGCDGCRKKSGVILKDDDGNEVTVQKHRCVFDDDMQTLYDLLDDADEVTVVSPVYFSGAPAPMKCVLDRLQPYYWAFADARETGEPLPGKRPLTLHVIGEGGDPHGYGALVSEVRSALATAGFRLQRMLDWVGKIDAAGEITEEATEIVPGDIPVSGAKPRPKLNLHSSIDERDGHGEEPSRKPAKTGRGAASSRQAAGATRSQAKSKGPSKSASGPARNAKGKPSAQSRGSAKGSARQSGRGQGKRRGN